MSEHKPGVTVTGWPTAPSEHDDERIIKLIGGDGPRERIYIEHSGTGIAFAGFCIGVCILFATALIAGAIAK